VKSEIRNSTFEANSNVRKEEHSKRFGFRHSSFVLASEFGFRASNFE